MCRIISCSIFDEIKPAYISLQGGLYILGKRKPGDVSLKRLHTPDGKPLTLSNKVEKAC